MKIKSLIIFILFILISNISQVEAACLIKDKPAPALLDYIKNNKLIIKNLTNSIVKAKNNLNVKSSTSKFQQLKQKSINDYDNASAETASIFNEIFNFTGYYSYFNYFVTYQIFNEVPYQVKRDYSLIDNEKKGLIQYLKKINQNGESDIVITNVCNGITIGLTKCKSELNNKKTIEIVGKLIKNNDKILDMYRSSVIGTDNDYDVNNFLLVDENFVDQIEFEYYSNISIGDCNKEKGGFFKQITTAIKNIKLINKEGYDGIQKWKDAFALLTGNAPDGEAEKIEKKKLKEYLSNNGVPTDKQEIIMKNLAETNSKGYSLNNNFIKNTYLATKKKLQKNLSIWKKQNFGDAIPKNNKKVAINNINNIVVKSNTTRNIEAKIATLYENEIPYIGVGNINTEILRGKIIKSHISIQNSIKTLVDTIPISQKVCRSQGGGGICN